MRAGSKVFVSLLQVAVFAFLPACDGIVDVKAHFGFTNTGSVPIQPVVDNQDAGPVIPPHHSAAFDASIRMSIPANDNAPAQHQISVPIAARAVNGSFITQTISCEAGPSVVTSATFAENTYGGPGGYVSCQSAQSYDKVPKKDSLALIAPSEAKR